MRGTLIDCVQSSLLTSRLAAYVGEALHADLLAGVRPGLRAQFLADRRANGAEAPLTNLQAGRLVACTVLFLYFMK